MQIVIDIDEEVYKDAMSGISNGLCRYSNEAIRNGTPLPKGHDRLVEARAVIKALFGKQTIDDVPTIIEADNSEVN